MKLERSYLGMAAFSEGAVPGWDVLVWLLSCLSWVGSDSSRALPLVADRKAGVNY